MTAAIQAVIFFLSDSIALLADLIHYVGDALTAVPLGIAFALRSQRAENYAGLAVVLAIFVSACAAAYEAIVRLINPHAPTHLLALGLAGAAGFVMAGACKATGVPLFSPHDLRHRYASVKIREGVPVTDLAAQLGHARTSMTVDTLATFCSANRPSRCGPGVVWSARKGALGRIIA